MITKFLDKWLSTDGGEDFSNNRPAWWLGCATIFSLILIVVVVCGCIKVFLP